MKNIPMLIKDITATGTFDGILSTYNNIDLGGQLVEPGAFTKTIQEHGPTVPMLWQHKSDKPIGTLTLIDAPDALRVKGQLLLDVDDAKKAYLLIKAQVVKGLSIGYDTIKDAVEGGVVHLKELRLWEGSIVTFPMNQLAMITAVKANQDKKDFSTELAEIQLQEASYQMWIALRAALCSLPWASDLTREEKIAASAECIQQFSEAYMAFFPAYLDYLEEEYGAMNTMERAAMETKAGRKISAANLKQLKAAHEHSQNAQGHAKSAEDILFALLDDEAADESEGTSGAKAAIPMQAEPEEIHSVAEILQNLKARYGCVKVA